MKKIVAMTLALLLVLGLAACGSTSKTAESAEPEQSAAPQEAPAEETAAETYTVGICQLVQHPALDAATQGFMDALIERWL